MTKLVQQVIDPLDELHSIIYFICIVKADMFAFVKIAIGIGLCNQNFKIISAVLKIRMLLVEHTC